MGPELFDFAFKKYAQKWMFKHPTPEDFFRTMEDASAVDLDWFWRGWFYGTDNVDISIEEVKHYVPLPIDAKAIKESQREDNTKAEYIYFKRVREEGYKAETQSNSELKDFYNDYDEFEVKERDIRQAEDLLASLTPDEAKIIDKAYHYYEISFANIGGLVMPVILKLQYADGTSMVQRIPAEVWRRNTENFTKLFVSEKEVVQFEIDPYLELPDTDRSNNYVPRQMVTSRFQLYKTTGSGRYGGGGSNPMREEARNKK